MISAVVMMVECRCAPREDKHESAEQYTAGKKLSPHGLNYTTRKDQVKPVFMQRRLTDIRK